MAGLTGTAFGFSKIHNLDYDNSPYTYKKMPALEKPTKFLYQVTNNFPKSNDYDVTITISNIDENSILYSEKKHYEIKSGEWVDVFWEFIPETTGMYLLQVDENEKSSRYFFAVPKNDELRKMAKKNPEFVADKSPRQQFRMGLDTKEIRCADGMYLAVKYTNLPVCATLDTLGELRKRDFVTYEFIEYEKIGYTLSETQFKKILIEKKVEYKESDFTLIQGWSLPMGVPSIGYCGYVLSTNNEDYWFSSNTLGFNLTDYSIYDENPEPCKGYDYSCGCSLQTKLTEKKLTQLSHFDKDEEFQVGKIFADYLNEGGKIANVGNSFVVGKYNLDISPDIDPFCGQFQDKHTWYFIGHIKERKIVDFGLTSYEKPKLCAINESPQIFTFEESAIVKDSFTEK